MLAWMLTCLRQWYALRNAALPAAAPPSPAPGEPAPPLTTEDLKQAQAVIGRVSELATGVAEDVGQHQSQIEDINLELAGVAQGDARAVANVIGRLLAANSDLQTRLERAELKLQAHSRQLQDAVAAARTDSLTGLMNRRALDEELRRAIATFQRRGRPSALLLLDVDHFKQFNDSHGHVAGDEALKYVADVLRTHSRESDIVARFGGEEFAIIFAATTAAAVRQRAEEVRSAIGRGQVVYEGRGLALTASAGLAETAEGEDITQWIKRADAALYAAKEHGRKTSFWSGPTGLERIELRLLPEQHPDLEFDEPSGRPHRESAAELASEAFADTSFVQQVGRRIAEWRRGGATFSVIFARLTGCCEPAGSEPARQPALRVVMQLARDSIREMDVLTRWTSDGQAVLLPGASVADTRVIARRLHAAVARHPSPAGPDSGQLALSTGIAEGIEGNDAQRVLQRAWLAVEAAASAGPGSICIHDGLKTLAVTGPALAALK